jgi:hypothetical protein
MVADTARYDLTKQTCGEVNKLILATSMLIQAQ